MSGRYDWLLFAHVLAGAIWLGALVLLTALAVLILRAPELAEPFTGALRRIGPIVLAPLPVLVLGLGVWMVADSAAWSFGQLWIVLALVLFGLAFAIGAAHQSRAALAAERAARRGDHAEAARRLRAWAWGSGTIAVLLTAALWDMVFKPGL
jgi:uncharacterized membrane protein